MRQRATAQTSISNRGRPSLASQVAALFAAMSGPKLWLDPSDPATRYQDFGGTPTVADSTPFALLADRSQALLRGAENIANPGPAFAATTGWITNGSLSVVGGKLRCTATGAGLFRATIGQGTAIGRLFAGLISISGTVNTQAGAWQFSTASGVLAVAPSALAPRVDSITFVASATYYVGVTANATAAGDFFEIDFVSAREILGAHVGQITAPSRPLYRTDGLLHWAQADGADDGWVSLANFDASGTDKLTLIAGVRKRNDAVAGVLAELSALYTTPGSFGVFAPPTAAAASYQAGITGATTSAFASVGSAAPEQVVLTIAMDLAGATGAAALSIQRNNGVPIAGNTPPGARNFVSAALNLLRRNNANTPAAVDLFGLMLLPGVVSPADLAIFKTYMAQKSGVTL